MSLTKEEMETIIRFDETNAPAVVYTNNLALKNKLFKLAALPSSKAVFESSDGFEGETYLVPKQWVKVVPPKAVSDAQKSVLKANAIKYGFKKKKATA
ncbi:MAG: hypothetical protein LBJ12_00855 [Oscillospiraceae bacterium]|jgi:hypothetical protein|nr:hypothetical protein [Oscillospiraceae bacterium]